MHLELITKISQHTLYELIMVGRKPFELYRNAESRYIQNVYLYASQVFNMKRIPPVIPDEKVD